MTTSLYNSITLIDEVYVPEADVDANLLMNTPSKLQIRQTFTGDFVPGSNHDGSDTGLIVGIVVGVIGALVLFGIVVSCIRRANDSNLPPAERARRQRERASATRNRNARGNGMDTIDMLNMQNMINTQNMINMQVTQSAPPPSTGPPPC